MTVRFDIDGRGDDAKTHRRNRDHPQSRDTTQPHRPDVERANPITRLHQSFGNQAVRRIVGDQDHPLTPNQQRTDDELRDSRPATADRDGGAVGEAHDLDGPVVPSAVRDVVQRAGRPLDREVQAAMERRFDADLGNVRIHTDPMAAASSRRLNARAYTVGSDIVFDRGEYEPSDPDAQQILTHELTHVVQRGVPQTAEMPVEVVEPGSRVETEARDVAAGGDASAVREQLGAATVARIVTTEELGREGFDPTAAKEAVGYHFRTVNTWVNRIEQNAKAAISAFSKRTDLNAAGFDIFESLLSVLQILPKVGQVFKMAGDFLDYAKKVGEVMEIPERMGGVRLPPGTRVADEAEERVVEWANQVIAANQRAEEVLRGWIDAPYTPMEGSIEAEFAQVSRPPSVDEQALREFRREFEVDLYRRQYLPNMHIERWNVTYDTSKPHNPPVRIWGPRSAPLSFGRNRWLFGLPNDRLGHPVIANRIRELRQARTLEEALNDWNIPEIERNYNIDPSGPL